MNPRMYLYRASAWKSLHDQEGRDEARDAEQRPGHLRRTEFLGREPVDGCETEHVEDRGERQDQRVRLWRSFRSDDVRNDVDDGEHRHQGKRLRRAVRRRVPSQRGRERPDPDDECQDQKRQFSVPPRGDTSRLSARSVLVVVVGVRAGVGGRTRRPERVPRGRRRVASASSKESASIPSSTFSRRNSGRSSSAHVRRPALHLCRLMPGDLLGEPSVDRHRPVFVDTDEVGDRRRDTVIRWRRSHAPTISSDHDDVMARARGHHLRGGLTPCDSERPPVDRRGHRLCSDSPRDAPVRIRCVPAELGPGHAAASSPVAGHCRPPESSVMSMTTHGDVVLAARFVGLLDQSVGAALGVGLWRRGPGGSRASDDHRGSPSLQIRKRSPSVDVERDRVDLARRRRRPERA